MPFQPEKISLRQVSKRYEKKHILTSFSLSIKKGEIVALIGPSGAGKSTLLNAIAGILSIDGGELLIDGLPIEKLSDRKVRAKKVGVIRQQFDLVGQLPAIHNVLAGRLSDWGTLKSLLSLVIPQDKELAMRALNRVGLADKAFMKTAGLSGGEQQRVAIARLLVQNPEIIIADEPVSSLDPARAEAVIELLKNIALEGEQTLVASLHSVEYATKHFHRLIGLREGRIFFDLPANKVTEAHISSLYQLKEQQE